MLPPQDSVCPLPALARHATSLLQPRFGRHHVLPALAVVFPEERVGLAVGPQLVYPVRAGEEVGLQELAMTPLDCHIP